MKIEKAIRNILKVIKNWAINLRISYLFTFGIRSIKEYSSDTFQIKYHFLWLYKVFLLVLQSFETTTSKAHSKANETLLLKFFIIILIFYGLFIY